jgi:hypothetical protein
MVATADFEAIVRDDIWLILSRKYQTVRHGGHPLDRDEYLRERTFWPDMRFARVDLVKTPDGGPEIRIVFSPSTEPDSAYGYRVDVDKATAVWHERIGIEPRQNPPMFAAELIWYMVAYIGSIDIAECPEGEDGVRWINDGDDVFKALPGTEDEHH